MTEMIFTFIYASLFIQISQHTGTPSMLVNAITIGGGLFQCLTSASSVTGGCLNPAIGFAQQLFEVIYDKNIYKNTPKPVTLYYMPAYVLGPIFGGLLSGLFSAFVIERALEESRAVDKR